MQLFGQDRAFIREYLYRASETDSRISSRQKALSEVKALLIEELGIYVESYVNYQIVEEDERITKEFFSNEIKTLSAGTTETIILEENWDGYEYYVKAQIKADPNEVLLRINQTLSSRRSNLVIDSLKLLLTASNNEITKHNHELGQLTAQVQQQNNFLRSKERDIAELNLQLESARRQLASYQRQERQLLTQIEEIELKIKTATTSAVNNVRIGMIPSEVVQVCGRPRALDVCIGKKYYNYGDVWVMFDTEVVVSVFPAVNWDGPCGWDSYKEFNLIK